MTYDEICAKIEHLTRQIGYREDFIRSTRLTQQAPDIDLDERFNAIVAEARHRNEVDAERLAGLYVERDLMEALMEVSA